VRFGPVAVAEAEGGILAHLTRAGGRTLKKGTVLGPEHIALLREAGIASVTAARLDPGDVDEDTAAARVARAVAGLNMRVDAAATGRCNLFAEAPGLFCADRALVDGLNRLDPGLTLATLPDFSPVEAGRMVATVKIIPFALPGEVVERAAALGAAARNALAVHPFRALRIGLVATILPSLKASVMDKTRRVLEARLAPSGSVLITERRVPHDSAAVGAALAELAQAGADLLIVFGASAITDLGDVIPAGLVGAGGRVIHFGMPVDPGNLLLLGDLAGRPVLGAPGCARSPAENGFDWILDRLLAGLEVTPEAVTGLGVGGLLMEITSRPQPRQAATGPKVAAVILAAGRSSRMGGPNKLLATLDGEPMIRRVARAVLASRASPAILVTGAARAQVEAAVAGLDVIPVHNPDYADGLAGSLKTGLAALPPEAEGVFVVLGDMPLVTATHLDRLIDAFAAAGEGAIVVPTHRGERGNPVLWSARYLPEMADLQGDEGARRLLASHADALVEVELDEGVRLDVDTPVALTAIGGAFAIPAEEPAPVEG